MPVAISSFDNQLPLTQPQLSPPIPACNNQARAVKDGEAPFGDTLLGDAYQNLAEDDSGDDEPPSQLGRNAVTKYAKLK
jgi:hypothetical protein